MAKKDPKRRARTRARIMDAYWDLYSSDPSRNVTASAVIAEAGVHRSTFYEYFGDAEAVLLAIEDELVALFGAESAAALACESVDPAGIVRRVYVKHGERVSALLGDSGDPRFARRVKDVLKPLAIGKLGLSDDPLAPYIVEFATSGLIAVASLWYERGCDLAPDEFGEAIHTMLLGATSMVEK